MMSPVTVMSSNGCAGLCCIGKKGVGLGLNNLEPEVLRMLMVLVWNT